MNGNIVHFKIGPNREVENSRPYMPFPARDQKNLSFRHKCIQHLKNEIVNIRLR